MHDKLTAYIPQLDDPEFVRWIGFYGDDEERFRAGWDRYSGTVWSLLDEIDPYVEAHPEENLIRYNEILERAHVWGSDAWSADVSSLDATTTMALLVAVYRDDHFCNGAFIGHIKDGCVRHCLGRLQELDALK